MIRVNALLIGFLLLACVALAPAQIDSTKTSGNWNSASTWQSGTVPTGSGTYIVRISDSLYFNVATTITGIVRNLSGKIGVFDSSKVVFGNGSVYESAVNGGSLPKVVWATGSTCLITGAVGNSPSNGNQNFYNLTWDCIGQTGGLNLGMIGNTIGGDIRVIRSNSQYFRLTASNNVPVSGRKTITINGNIIVDSLTGFFTSTGSSGSDSFTVILKGGIVSHGTCNFANGSGASVTWLVAGDVKALGGSMTTNSTLTKPDSVILNGTKKQVLVRGGGTGSLSNIFFRVKSGSTLDLDTNSLGGSVGTSITIDSAATIITAHAKGFRGNLNNAGGTFISGKANFVYDGTAAQADSLIPATMSSLTINNASGVTFFSNKTVNDTLRLTAGTLSDTIVLAPTASVQRVSGYIAGPFQKTLSAGLKTFEVGTLSGYSPVDVKVNSGSGPMTVSAVQAKHPNSFDSTKTLARYWILNADPGITNTDLTFYYPAADVNGIESKYGAYRYTGTGTTWDKLVSKFDTTNHWVSTKSVSSFGVFTLGESDSTSVNTGVRSTADPIPHSFFVEQNYPNPFNPSTSIVYGLPNGGYVSAKVYNLLGQEVANLFDGYQNAGIHTLVFNASNLSSGVYLYRIHAGSRFETKRMILMK